MAETPQEVRLRLGFEPELFQRALMAWWQSAVPPAPFAARAVHWAVIWGGVLAVALLLGAIGLAPAYAAAGLAGAGVLVLAFAILQRVRMRRFRQVIARHWDAAGVAEAVFDAGGISLRDRVSRLDLDWAGVEAVRGARGVTVIRSGMRMIFVPDRALPDDLPPREFRARLAAWRRA